MGVSGDYICPKCGFVYAQYEHEVDETTYYCVVCGWEGWKLDTDYKIRTTRKASPKALKLSKIVAPVMTKLWQDKWCSEAFQYNVNSDYLYNNIEKYGLGGVFVHLFTANMS